MLIQHKQTKRVFQVMKGTIIPDSYEIVKRVPKNSSRSHKAAPKIAKTNKESKEKEGATKE